MRLPMIALALAGCASMEGSRPGALAELRDPGGRAAGRATFSEMHDGLHVRVEATGLAPGAHAVHLHATGRCEPPDFESAGGHWNPTSREHGTLNPRGHHRGDLPNVAVGANGRGSIEAHIQGATLRGLLDADGAALVIHAGPDDYRTDPSGDSGARIACGVLR